MVVCNFFAEVNWNLSFNSYTFTKMKTNRQSRVDHTRSLDHRSREPEEESKKKKRSREHRSLLDIAFQTSVVATMAFLLRFVFLPAFFAVTPADAMQTKLRSSNRAPSPGGDTIETSPISRGDLRPLPLESVSPFGGESLPPSPAREEVRTGATQSALGPFPFQPEPRSRQPFPSGADSRRSSSSSGSLPASPPKPGFGLELPTGSLQSFLVDYVSASSSSMGPRGRLLPPDVASGSVAGSLPLPVPEGRSQSLSPVSQSWSPLADGVVSFRPGALPMRSDRDSSPGAFSLPSQLPMDMEHLEDALIFIGLDDIGLDDQSRSSSSSPVAGGRGSARPLGLGTPVSSPPLSPQVINMESLRADLLKLEVVKKPLSQRILSALAKPDIEFKARAEVAGGGGVEEDQDVQIDIKNIKRVLDDPDKANKGAEEFLNDLKVEVEDEHTGQKRTFYVVSQLGKGEFEDLGQENEGVYFGDDAGRATVSFGGNENLSGTMLLRWSSRGLYAAMNRSISP